MSGTVAARRLRPMISLRPLLALRPLFALRLALREMRGA